MSRWWICPRAEPLFDRGHCYFPAKILHLYSFAALRLVPILQYQYQLLSQTGSGVFAKLPLYFVCNTYGEIKTLTPVPG